MAVMTPHSAKNIVYIAAEPKFFFMPDTLHKIRCYVEECDKEIGWLGRVLRQDDVFLCNEVFLLKQEVGPAATDITTEGLVELIEEIGLEENETLRLWGHSHVNMGVSPSGQDKEQMKIFRDSGCEFFFRIICNKRGEIGVTFFNWKDNYIIDDMTWAVVPEAAEDAVRTAIKAEIAEKVTPFNYGRRSTTLEKWNDPDYEWDRDKRCYVKKKNSTEAEKKNSLTTDGGTDTRVTAIDFAVLYPLYLEIPEWVINRMLESTKEGSMWLLNNSFVTSLMSKYKVSLSTMYDLVMFLNGRDSDTEATEGYTAGYVAKCEAALAELTEDDAKEIAKYPKLSKGRLAVKRVCKKYDIDYEDLADVAFTKYSDLVK